MKNSNNAQIEQIIRHIKEKRALRVFVIATIFAAIGGILLLVSTAVSNEIRGELLRSVGAAAVAGAFLMITLDRVSLASITEQFSEVISNFLREIELQKYGIIAAENETPFGDVIDDMRRTKSLVIVQTWSPRLKEMLDRAVPMVLRGGQIEVILLHPDSDICFQRSVDLNAAADHVSGQIRTDIDSAKEFARLLRDKHELSEEDVGKRFSLRLFEHLPTLAIYKTDNVCWVAFYWLGTQSAYRMNQKIDTQSENAAIQHINQQIEQLEQRSLMVPLFGNGIPTLEDVRVASGYLERVRK